MQIRLRPRLLAVAELIGAGAQVVADIGCDHGRLSAALVQRGAALRVIASDISPDSLAKARSLAAKCKLEDAISLTVSDGLSHLVPGEAHAIVLAGMGGELAAKLLKEGAAVAEAAPRIVIQPMGGTLELRRFLYQNGYAILEERIVFDAGRYYQVLAVQHEIGQSAEMPSDALLEFGPVAFAARDPLLRPMLLRVRDSRRRKMQRALARGVVPEQLAKELNGVEELLALLSKGDTE